MSSSKQMTWKLKIFLVIAYNLALTVITWSYLRSGGYTDIPMSTAPVLYIGIGVMPLQAALYKLNQLVKG